MNIPEQGFKFLKIKNGLPYFAIVTLEAKEIKSESEIIENYSGAGFTSQGNFESIPKNGYDDWKIAARRGINFVLNLSNRNWRVTIHSIEGRIATDTNPTIVGYVTILALCTFIGFELDETLKEELDRFVFKSWKEDNSFKIPDFETLGYN